MKLLEQFVKLILNERSFDTRTREFVTSLLDDIVSSIGDAKFKSFNFKYQGQQVSSFYTTLGMLGIIVPTQLKQLGLGIISAPNIIDKPDATYLSGDPNRPEGMIMVFTDKPLDKKTIDRLAARLFSEKKEMIYHELVHFFELFVLNDKSRLNHHSNSLEKLNAAYNKEQDREIYYKQDHELNAYFHQAFEKFMNSLAPKTKQEASEIVPNAHTLWSKFLPNLSNGVKSRFSDLDLRKKFVARLWELWEDAIQTLPDA